MQLHRLLKKIPSGNWINFLFLILLNFFAHSAKAQKEGKIWYFGENAGLDFNTNPPTILTDGQTFTREGCASIADRATGQLLFYTDGTSVWGKNHVLMPGIPAGGLGGNSSSTQSGVIVPDPTNVNEYYLFSVDYLANGPIFWSKVDMTLNGGNGQITSSKNLLLDYPCEKIASIGNCKTNEYWVVGHKFRSDSFYAWKVTASGIAAPVISKVGSIYGIGGSNSFQDALGYMKFSPSGRRIATANWHPTNKLEVFDFDASTGIISNPITDTIRNVYGCSFSPDNSKLYAASQFHLYQYDLSSNNASSIIASRTLISSVSNYGALQNAVNGKMYHAGTGTGAIGNNSLNVINNPNLLGVNCNFVANAQPLGTGKSQWGLPSIVETFLSEGQFTKLIPPSNLTLCLGESTNMIIPDDYLISISPSIGTVINSDTSLVTFTPTSTTTYKIVYRDRGFCNILDSISFTITIGNVIAQFDVNPETTVMANPVFTMNNRTLNATDFKWYHEGLLFATSPNPSISFTDTGTYCFTLVASNTSGCVDSAVNCGVIEAPDWGVFIPNAFSPNGDGKNNTFKAKYDHRVEFVSMDVYNRYGNRVFSTTNSFEDWDGKYKGVPCEIGVYFYMFKYKKRGKPETIILKGDLHLIR